MKKKRKEPSLAQKLADEMDLESLRFQRDIAKHNGDFKLAFTLATAIDIKHGYYGNPPGGRKQK
jgi:hypothetical protein